MTTALPLPPLSRPAPRPGTAPVRVVHTVASLRRAHGGPSRSVVALCDALARAGAEVALVTSPPPSGDTNVAPAEAGVRLLEVPAPGAAALLPGVRTAFGRAVSEALGAGGIVHDHGMWLPSNAVAAREAARAGAPLVASPKGMASAWSLGNGRAKKKLAWALYQRRVFAGAALVQVTADDERADVDALRVGRPLGLVCHGIDLPTLVQGPRASASGREALFLSRVHPKKGLPLLVEVWARVRPAGWRLTVAGPDEGGHRADLEALVAARGLGEAVRFVGPVEGEEKDALWAAADLFVLPTHSENFGLAIAEALAHGVPALTTHGAPWAVLEAERMGWHVPVAADALADALRAATALSDAERAAMGARARAYAERELRWDRAAERMLAAYRWLLGQAPRPDFVTLP